MLLRRQAPGHSRPVPLGDAGNAHRQDDRLLAQRQKRDSGSRHDRSIISILVLPLSPLMQRGDSAEAPPRPAARDLRWTANGLRLNAVPETLPSVANRSEEHTSNSSH